MTGPEVIQAALKSTKTVMEMLLADLSDADLLVRPVPGANHIAWQLGHLIASEAHLAKDSLPGAKYPPLPPGFAEQHSNDTSAAESTKGFLTKGQYLELFSATRQATIEAVGRLTPADLDKPTPEKWRQFAPTAGHMLLLVANHTMMHAGQFTPVRRKLGKPRVM
jgi:hypothetical protein